jgi:peptide/nickel transport system substrate-binding protein
MKRFHSLLAPLVALLAVPLAAAQTTVTLNVVQIFGTIDPAKVTDYTEYMAAVNFYDGLVTVDPNGTIQPNLAASWEVNDDATIFTFNLKEDATFHDGAPVTAADVVYSVQRLLGLDQGPSFLFRDVLTAEGVVALDEHTVQFTLDEVFSPFMATVPLIFVVNSELVKANTTGDDWGEAFLTDKEAGSGPYTLDSWSRGSEMRMARYDDYHQGWRDGPIDEVRFIVSDDEGTIRSLAAAGQLTMTSQYQSNETYDALARMERFRVVEEPTGTAFYLKFNTQVAPTDDVHVRRAISCAIDYDLIREEIFPGEPLTGPLPAGAFASVYLESLQAPTLDLDCAREELALSAYAGQTIPLNLAYVAGATFEEEIALLMQSVLEPLGFAVTLQPEPWNRITELASRVETTPHATQVFFGPTYPSPDSMFFTQYHSDAAGTWASMEWLLNEDVDRLIDQARATGDQEEQAAIYRELQQLIVDLQPDAFFLVQTVRHAMDNCLEGFNYIPVQSFDYNFYNYRWTCD